jgi:hypothetical protein
MREDLRLQEGVLVVEILKRLETAIEEGQELVIREGESEVIARFLSKTMSEGEYRHLNAYLTFLGKGKLWKTLKGVRELFQERDLGETRKKMEDLDRYLRGAMEEPANKLTSKDIRLLAVASVRTKLIRTLNDSLPELDLQGVCDQWKELSQINESEAAQRLRDSCMKCFAPGRVMFYDGSLNDVRDWHPFDLMSSIKHVLYGRIIHMAIVVENPEGEVSMSHVNGATNTHALHPVRFPMPMLGPISNLVELDISPLIPSNVSPMDRLDLQRHFSDKFIRLASEEHRNVILDWKLWTTFFLGHKSLFAQDPSQIDLDVKQSQLCASYIGVIFLKAIHQVNQKLSDLGYEKKIENPFGEHEIIDRVDILRLLYHWKKLKVMKAAPIDALAAKFFTSPSL